MPSGAVGLLEAGTWRMASAVRPCWARACALAPAVVAVPAGSARCESRSSLVTACSRGSWRQGGDGISVR